MRTTTRNGLAITAATALTSCQVLLGGFDFDGKPAGSGGGSSSTTSVASTTGSSGSTTTTSASSGSSGGACSPGDSEPCYTGPAGTEDAGVCKGGTSTCNGQGTGFGACTGQVTPAPKTCASGLDDACDGLPCVVWAQGYGPSSTSQEINAVALDPTDGSLVVTGDFTGSITFGSLALMSSAPTTTNTFVARIAADGTPVWAQAFAVSRGLAVVVDKTGSVFVAGKSDATAMVAATSLPSGEFILKLDKGGTPVWATCIGDTQMMFGAHSFGGITGMALAPDGDIVVAGYITYPPMVFTDGPLQGSGTAFIAKISGVDGTSSKANTGTHWAQFIPYSSNGTPPSFLVTGGPKVATDANGNVYLGTVFTGSDQVGGMPIVSTTGGTDIVLAMFDAMGNLVGASTMGNGMAQWVDAIAVDPFGAVALSGQVVGTLTFTNPNGSLVAKSPQGDGFVLQLNPGNPAPMFAWGTTFATNGEALDLGFDSKGDVRSVGWFTGTLDLGVGALAAGANRMMLLMELDGASGTPKWNRGWLYPGTNTNVRLAVAPAGDEFVGGRLDKGPFDVGTGALIQPTDPNAAWAGRFGP